MRRDIKIALGILMTFMMTMTYPAGAGGAQSGVLPKIQSAEARAHFVDVNGRAHMLRPAVPMLPLISQAAGAHGAQGAVSAGGRRPVTAQEAHKAGVENKKRSEHAKLLIAFNTIAPDLPLDEIFDPAIRNLWSAVAIAQEHFIGYNAISRNPYLQPAMDRMYAAAFAGSPKMQAHFRRLDDEISAARRAHKRAKQVAQQALQKQQVSIVVTPPASPVLPAMVAGAAAQFTPDNNLLSVR